jgi:hypothetical protein
MGANKLAKILVVEDSKFQSKLIIGALEDCIPSTECGPHEFKS